MRWPWFKEKGKRRGGPREMDAAEERAKEAEQAEETSPPDRQGSTSPASFVAVFQDTQRRIAQDAALGERTWRLAAETTVYPPGFRSAKAPRQGAGQVCFEENLTLLAARELKQRYARVAVLNFANPVEPGGGVLRGAQAQEEYLCRASNLYHSLTSPQAQPYYQAHLAMEGDFPGAGSFLASDAVIYSPGVTILREDIHYYPDEMSIRPDTRYTRHWMEVDVLTCAAPYHSSSDRVVDDARLKALFVKRFQNILEVAMEHDVKALVLGAFGCGAFNNPPMVVAQAAQQVMLQARYRSSFEAVVFAVKRSARFCENIEAFQACFAVFPPTGGKVLTLEGNKRRFFE